VFETKDTTQSINVKSTLWVRFRQNVKGNLGLHSIQPGLQLFMELHIVLQLLLGLAMVLHFLALQCHHSVKCEMGTSEDAKKKWTPCLFI
jgi:hypothetical protein